MDRIVFVWDCDAGVLGHVRYALGKLRGRSCALCDLSYRGLRPSAAFDACAAALPIPIVSRYRDQLGDELVGLLDGRYPAVVVESAGTASVLVGPEELAGIDTFAELEAILRETVAEHRG